MLIAPLWIPALTAALSLVLPSSSRSQRWLGIAGTSALMIASLRLLAATASGEILSLQIGGWPVPLGISLRADRLSAALVAVTAVIGWAVAIYARADVDSGRVRFGFVALLNALLLGVCGAFLTGDLFNLYVWFEVLLMASFVLLVLGGERQQLAAGLPYVTMNLISSALFLAAVGLTYATARTLDMADLSIRLEGLAEERPGLILSLAALFAISFGIKAAVVPLFFWLPASYHTPPPAISALFAGLLTKVGVYALLRLFTLVLPPLDATLPVLGTVAALTMVIGGLGAVAQVELRRILGFHVIGQIGYMIFGVALLGSPDPDVRRLGVAATVFYVIHHMLVKTNLYLIGGTVTRWSGTGRLSATGGFAAASPVLALLFLIPALSLAGLPPLSGFWAKLAVLQAGLVGRHPLMITAALFGAILTLTSMIKIWNEVFLKRPPPGGEPRVPDSLRERWARLLPSTALAILTLLIGLQPEALFQWADSAAEQLLDVDRYRVAAGLVTEEATR